VTVESKTGGAVVSSPIAERIWDAKYRFKRPDGTVIDQTMADTFQRVAHAAAAAEPKASRKHWEAEFLGAMAYLEFIPAGRILAGAGTQRRVTLFNCFVMGPIEDDLSAIFENVREAALTMQQGGGIGHDFSTLRPRGALVRSVGADASGPVSFMDVWDAMCRTILSAGQRRGAMMATLRCDHPDIEEFIAAKRDASRLRNFNLSVLVTDAFVTAVRADGAWPLMFAGKTYKTVQARALWRQIMQATYDAAEPGVIFIDQINAANNLSYCETISATNPCGEQPLPPYGACLLGSINLARLVSDPFAASARLDESRLAALTRTAVRFLDNIIDISGYPLPAQRREALAKRRIGLGLTGLADALIQCGVRYGETPAVQLAGRWMQQISEAAYRASADLAAEKGAFPLYDKHAMLARPNLRQLPSQIRAQIAEHGLRNGLLTSIAPTGTISLLAGNVSSGIEPVFDFRLKRRIRGPDGATHEDIVDDYAMRLYRARHGETAPLPPAFVRAADLTPKAHLDMQAAMQRHVDSSISKTINCPVDIPFEAFERIYLDAYDLGLKGCTTYRPNAITGAILSSEQMLSPKPDADSQTVDSQILDTGPAPAASTPREEASSNSSPIVDPQAGTVSGPLSGSNSGLGEIVYMAQPLERDPILPGYTYKLRWPDSDHAIYITINDIERDGRRRPFEVFINSKNLEHYAWTVALTRMISAVFRRGGDVTFVVDELKAVFDPRGGQWMDGRYVPSLLAAIGGVIERHMIRTGFLRREPDTAQSDQREMQTEILSRDVQTRAQTGAQIEILGQAGGAIETIPIGVLGTVPGLPKHGRTTAPASAPASFTSTKGRSPMPEGQHPGRSCPRCSMPALVHQEGCMVCLECGFSKCS
jgi:ribonucleoside-diphosphate reductase alpha chain